MDEDTETTNGTALAGRDSSVLLVRGQPIIWDKAISTGGKWPQPAVFIELRGDASALIEVDGKQRTVRMASIRVD